MNAITSRSEIPPFNRRERRATMIAAAVMQAIRPHLPRDAAPGAICDALLELFDTSDAEIITKEDRRQAGLPERNELGLSPLELHAIENKRLEILTRPAPPIIMVAEPIGGGLIPGGVSYAASPSVTLTDPAGRLRSLRDLQRDIIAAAVRICHGNKTNAMKALGIPRATFYRRIRKSA